MYDTVLSHHRRCILMWKVECIYSLLITSLILEIDCTNRINILNLTLFSFRSSKKKVYYVTIYSRFTLFVYPLELLFLSNNISEIILANEGYEWVIRCKRTLVYRDVIFIAIWTASSQWMYYIPTATMRCTR